MRVIAGKFKNRKLFSPKGLGTRPTSGKLREAVFNILQHNLEGTRFLDAFAGSGAMGFEALSRGAAQVVFLEHNKEALNCLSKNSEELDVKDQMWILKGDVYRSVDMLIEKGEKFDLIYADPPYAAENGPIFSSKLLKSIDTGKLLNKEGCLLIEESRGVDLERQELSNLKLVKRRDYGRSSLFQFEWAEKK